MQVEEGELQSALQYQVLSTGLQHGHLLVMVGGVQDQQWSTLPLEKQVSMAYVHTCRIMPKMHIICIQDCSGYSY